MPFKKGEGGRPKGSKNKTTLALAQRMQTSTQVLATRQTPLEMMLNIADHYYQRWRETKDSKEDEAVCRRAADMALHASRLAAPYVHARKLILEDDIAPTINVVDRREMGRVIAVNGSNGHRPNGHGSNGSNGHGSNGPNGHGNGNGSMTDLN